MQKYTEENIVSLNFDLASETWDDIYNQQDVDDAYKLFYTKLKQCLDKNIPYQKVSKKRQNIRNPWITKAILNSIHTKNRLFKQYIKNPGNTNYHVKFKKYMNKLNSVIKNARRNYYDEKFQKVKGDIASVWKVINNILGKGTKCNVPNEIQYDETFVSDNKGVANLLNQYFCEVGPNIANSMKKTRNAFHNYLSNKCENSVFFTPIQINDILEITKNLKSSMTNGYDDINTFVLR